MPVDTYGNAILMEFIGDEERPAPMLRHVSIAPSEARPLFDRLLRNIELMLAYDRVHADLSPFNVLYWRGRPTIIDFAQAVDARSGQDLLQLLLRDVDHIAGYFARNGVAADPQSIAHDMWSRYIRGEMRPAPALPSVQVTGITASTARG